MEVDDRQSEGEPEPDEEMLQDVVDYEEEVTPATLDERRHLLLPGRAVDTDPDLTQARAAMQPFYCPEMKQGKCIDTKSLHGLLLRSFYVQGMAYFIVMGYNAVLSDARKVFARVSLRRLGKLAW